MSPPLLRRGMRGDAVEELQPVLLACDYDLGPAGADGIFGPKTEAAVRVFQRWWHLAVDGVVGRHTWSALRETPSRQPSGLPIPNGQAEVRALFGDIRVHKDASPRPRFPLLIEGDWEARNMVTVPISGLRALRRIYCHRKLAPVFSAVFSEIVALGLGDEIKSYDGCLCVRYKRSTRRKKLSTHAWGIAVDLNAATNRQGTSGDMSREVVGVFRHHGFKWGGDWRRKYRDPMHFQYCTGY